MPCALGREVEGMRQGMGKLSTGLSTDRDLIMLQQSYPLFLVVVGEPVVKIVIGWDGDEPVTADLDAPNWSARHVHRQDFQVFIDRADAAAFARKQRAK